MHKVKFNTNQEYEFVGNFKALQACFTQHSVDKVRRALLHRAMAAHPRRASHQAQVPGQSRRPKCRWAR